MVFLIRIVVKAKMPRTGLACGHLERGDHGEP